MVTEPAFHIGRFAVVDRIGQGGMGVVYSAYDDELDRRVAIKLVKPERVDGRGRLRMRREAQAMARLSHPNVVHVYEVGEHDGELFVAMEYVDGQDLEGHPKAVAPGWRSVLQLYLQAAAGLQAAHDVGLVHRDFKPSNVLVSKDGIAKVADFGLARVEPVDGSTTNEPRLDSDGSVTHTGATVGTPRYMAPEQFLGAPVDARTDQFAFCVSLYEGLYGAPPFAGTHRLLIADAVTRGDVQVPPGNGVPSWIWPVIRKGLSVDRDDRHPDMSTVIRKLRADPRRTWRRGVYLAVGLAGAAAVGLAVGRGSTTSPDPCADRAGLLASTWNASRRGEVEASFAATGLPYAGAAFEAAARDIDQYVQGWTEASRYACDAALVRRVWSSPLFDQANACLEQRRQRLAAVVDVLSVADAGVAARGSQIVASVPPLEECTMVDRLLDPLPSPEPAVAEAVAEQREHLADAYALAGAAKFERAERLGLRSHRVAEETGDPVLRMEAAYFLALTVAAQMRHGEDYEWAKRAYLAAVSVGNRGWITKTAVERFGAAVRSQSLDDARVVADETLAQAGRDVDLDPSQLAWAWTYRARMHMQAGDLDAAWDDIEVAWSLVQTHHLDAQRSRNIGLTRATIASQRGQWRVALAHCDAAVTDAESRFGPDHPAVAEALAERGFTSLRMGRAEAAVVDLERAVSWFDSSLGGDSEALPTALNNLAGAYTETGQAEHAVQALQRVHALRLAQLGPDHVLTAHPLNNLGNALIDLGRYDEARDAYARAESILSRAQGADHPDVSYPVFGLGDVALRQGHAAEAATHFARATALRDTPGASPTAVNAARFAHARALAQVPGRWHEAVDLARAAAKQLEALDEASPKREQMAAEIATWLASTHDPDATDGD
jgi:tetratricopeptide (TPR) repeat protein